MIKGSIQDITTAYIYIHICVCVCVYTHTPSKWAPKYTKQLYLFYRCSGWINCVWHPFTETLSGKIENLIPSLADGRIQEIYIKEL